MKRVASAAAPIWSTGSITASSRIARRALRPEVASVIEKVGPGVSGWKEGDQGVFLRGPAQGGWFRRVFASRARLPWARLPEALSFVEGAPAQQIPIAVQWHAQGAAGRPVVVFGAGSARLAVTQMAHVRGAARLVTLDPTTTAWNCETARRGLHRERPPGRVLWRRCLACWAPGRMCASTSSVFQASPASAWSWCALKRNVTIFGTYHEHDATFSLLRWEIEAISTNVSNEGFASKRPAEAMRIAERLLGAGRLSTRVHHPCALLREVPKGLELLATSPPPGAPRPRCPRISLEPRGDQRSWLRGKKPDGKRGREHAPRASASSGAQATREVCPRLRGRSKEL